MHVLLDVSAATFAPGGTRTYVTNLARALDGLPETARAELTISRLPGWLSPGLTKGIGHKLRVLLWESLYMQAVVPSRGLRADVIHAPALRFPLWRPRPLVVTILDVIPLIFPAHFRRRDLPVFHFYLHLARQFAHRVITISAQSRQDIHHHLGIPLDRISVTPIGVGPQFRPIGPPQIKVVLDRHRIEPPYILSVGTLEPRKNLRRVLEMFARVRKVDNARHRLVLVGRRGWRHEPVVQMAARLHVEDHVQATGFIPDEDLPALYNGADVFVYPSLYEGFGLPPLEAMACGCPVVASNVSAVPEVVGSAGRLVDPYDVTAITEAVLEVLGNETLARSLRAVGLERAAQFSWRRCAEQTLEAYRRAL